MAILFKIETTKICFATASKPSLFVSLSKCLTRQFIVHEIHNVPVAAVVVAAAFMQIHIPLHDNNRCACTILTNVIVLIKHTHRATYKQSVPENVVTRNFAVESMYVQLPK